MEADHVKRSLNRHRWLTGDLSKIDQRVVREHRHGCDQKCARPLIIDVRDAPSCSMTILRQTNARLF